jgi:hypothetical protein
MATSRSSNRLPADRNESIHQDDVLWINAFPLEVVGFFGCGDSDPDGIRTVWVRGAIVAGYGLPPQEVTFRVPVNQPLARVVGVAPVQPVDDLPADRVIGGQRYQRRLIDAA